MDEDTTRSQFSELVRYSRAMLTAAGIVTLVIMVVGVIGNLLTVFALMRNSKIRTVAAAFIASLCISDLMFCFIVLPFAASQFFHGTWIHGDVLCTIIPVLRYGCVGVSLLSIAMISVNRYILIAWPHVYGQIYTKAKVAIYITAIWLFSYGLQIPTLLGQWGLYGFDKRLGTCSINKDANGRSSKTALFVIGFALPCAVIVVCYANIFWVVRKSHKRLKQHNSGGDYKRSEMKITKMVLVIFVCFVVCYLPITIVKIFDPEVKQAPLHVLGYILIYISSCVNPVVYVTMNKQYRQAYLDTLRCRMTSAGDSMHTPSPHSRTHLSVGYLKNVVNNSPKV
ncbi:G-protein coupled receptor moody isoform X1 [Tribolium castaneum]|uniref:G-protein coupled receptor moody-like Protein n=2 Tax=Tribolium castaneum TaxID=7070 RepID=D2A286_TRICA|nr:PREDICTED: G-protein coupled receptor moody isoform X1 [Tribolium castaneum]EFA02848.1 G-protein coupled receptor moody-like Protein [Tribolium castaneum]|eukprot:XP_974272.1 PREDICTED: G-protein coupled receptor moody isoform X1 [Tribolium castaneum]